MYLFFGRCLFSLKKEFPFSNIFSQIDILMSSAEIGSVTLMIAQSVILCLYANLITKKP